MGLNLKWLQTIAEGYLDGRPCLVAYLPHAVDGLAQPLLGQATFEGCFCVLLNERLATDRRDALLDTFLHEVGHLVAGHVPDRVIESEQYSLAEIRTIIGGASAEEIEMWRRVRDTGETQEKQVDEWVQVEAAKWRAASEEAGTTFEALAIIEETDDD